MNIEDVMQEKQVRERQILYLVPYIQNLKQKHLEFINTENRFKIVSTGHGM